MPSTHTGCSQSPSTPHSVSPSGRPDLLFRPLRSPAQYTQAHKNTEISRAQHEHHRANAAQMGVAWRGKWERKGPSLHASGLLVSPSRCKGAHKMEMTSGGVAPLRTHQSWLATQSHCHPHPRVPALRTGGSHSSPSTSKNVVAWMGPSLLRVPKATITVSGRSS